ncbi:carboxypeptidase-like regulatory domain-containing protein [Reichenbachiella carrageenanivorans]|uniref:Carboxypeptidase-like regulatory domain-containing protein n=1 Tax=Reichenbachiella carrageenanivorans TaxID=2979869 RepID=A0ABY6CVH4_9BACT|nr:carboxypeptidase-like regulatory domain-containing protein [Reichenbachiella carrageenanivorans]UXX77909.1 carboxypeptidase-like regulatory domain-containing protein [Reichenbachiella carrageenanivorans]
MKKYLIITFLFLAAISVSAYEFADFKFLPTSLKVTVLDELGNPVEAAEVTLFKNKEDYKAHVNPLEKKVTDESGEVVFKKLDPKSYFVHADFQNKNNVGLGVQTEILIEGRINKVNTVVQ